MNAVHHGSQVGFLFFALVGLAQERRIAQHITAPLRRQHFVPVQPQRVGVAYLWCAFERDAGKVQAKLHAHAQVHLVVHQPQGHLGNLCRKFFDLDAKELVHVHADQAVHIHRQLALVGAQFVVGPQHLQLQLAQFAVADDQEVAAPTGRVKKRQLAQLFVKFKQLVAVAFDPLKLGVQFVQKQGLDQLEDVGLRRVVRTQVAAGFLVHDALEQAAKNRRADGRPVERTGVQQGFAHGGAEVGHGQGFFKQAAVDVRKLAQLFVDVFAALALWRVQHLKQLPQARPQV